jgi:hypothetical protein
VNKLTVTIRLLLTAALLVGVYHETGIWTTVAVGLLGLSNELTAFVLRRFADRMKRERVS